MKRIDRLLHESIEREEVLRAARAWAALREWDSIVGAALAARSMPERYERGTVWVAVMGSTWAAELRMRKDVILLRLREISGEPKLFEKLRFGVRTFDKAVVMAPGEKAAGPPRELEDRSDLSIRDLGERLMRKARDAGRD